MVSVWSIVFMVISLLVSIILSFGIFLFLRKRIDLKVVPALVGAAAFIVFAMVLEQLLHMLVLKRAPDGSLTLMKTPALYVLYGAFAAGIFEETGRFLGFLLLKRKYKGFNTAISYGIGHGGIEALLVLGLTMVSTIVISVMVNTGMANVLGDTPQITAAVEQITGAAPWMFALGGLERVFAIAIHISLSVIVWHSVNTKGKVWMYPLAIVLHAAVDVVAAMGQVGVIKNVILVEAILLPTTAALVLFTIWIHRKLIIKSQDFIGNFIE